MNSKQEKDSKIDSDRMCNPVSLQETQRKVTRGRKSIQFKQEKKKRRNQLIKIQDTDLQPVLFYFIFFSCINRFVDAMIGSR